MNTLEEELAAAGWTSKQKMKYEADNQVCIVTLVPFEAVPFKPGDVVELGFANRCSACGQGDTSYKEGVRVKCYTRPPYIWRGYWWCPEHWAKYSGSHA